jgi:hypothetical protein
MSGGRFPLRTGLGALVGVLLVGALGVVSRAAAPAPAATADATHGRVSGVAFLTENIHIAGASSEFQHIKADGANTVSFDVWYKVPSYSSSIVGLCACTDSDADLITAAIEARRAGLQVTLTPKIIVGNGGYTTNWRGTYNPPDPSTFFSGYQKMIDHYADLAQRTGMSMFFVGSEMVRSDGYVGAWRQIIASARQHFRGPISYEEDWREVPRFAFGDALDVVSVSGYFPTSDEERPTLAQLEAGWHSYTQPGQSQPYDAFSAIAAQAERWGKPILFGEAGYMATTYPGQNPCCNNAHPIDPTLQYLAYKALLDTFSKQPWWDGVMWWAWNNGDPRSPEGKPAERLLAAQAVAYPTSPASPAPPRGPGPVSSHATAVGAGARVATDTGHGSRHVGAVVLGGLVLALALASLIAVGAVRRVGTSGLSLLAALRSRGP